MSSYERKNLGKIRAPPPKPQYKFPISIWEFLNSRGEGLDFSKMFELYITLLKNKNSVKWTRQHAGKKYGKAEYVQHRVCFVNEQVSWPDSNINVKFCTSRHCVKMSSFLFVRAWAMPRILYLSCGVPFPVWTPDNISVLISVVLWLLRWEVIKTFQVIFS